MSNSTLKLLLKEYDKKRLEKELELDKKLELFYSEHPEVSNINDKINKTSIEISKSILQNKDYSQLQNNLEKYKKEKFLLMPVYLFFSYDQQNLFPVKKSVVSKR